jgi:hypothetical protein
MIVNLNNKRVDIYKKNMKNKLEEENKFCHKKKERC